MKESERKSVCERGERGGERERSGSESEREKDSDVRQREMYDRRVARKESREKVRKENGKKRGRQINDYYHKEEKTAKE